MRQKTNLAFAGWSVAARGGGKTGIHSGRRFVWNGISHSISKQVAAVMVAAGHIDAATQIDSLYSSGGRCGANVHSHLMHISWAHTSLPPNRLTYGPAAFARLKGDCSKSRHPCYACDVAYKFIGRKSFESCGLEPSLEVALTTLITF